jgi:hypothetical protein
MAYDGPQLVVYNTDQLRAHGIIGERIKISTPVAQKSSILVGPTFGRNISDAEYKELTGFHTTEEYIDHLLGS